MDSLNPYNPFEDKKPEQHYNQEQLDFIKQLLSQGWPVSRLVTEYGVNGPSIKKRIAENNWKAGKLNRNGALTNKELAEIHQQVSDGIAYDDICNRYQISMESLLRRVQNNKWSRGKRKTKYAFDESYFDDIATEHQAYWLGFLYADGYILSRRNRRPNLQEQQSFGFCISSKDSELFAKIKEDLKSNHPVNYYRGGSFGPESSCGRILFTSQNAVDSLKKYGLMENKTFFLTWPNLPQQLYPAFIRGYSDGDGSVIIDKNGKYSWQLCGTKELLSGVQTFLGTNVKLHQRWPERENNNFSLYYYGNHQVPSLLDIIYKGSTICLQRKYDKYAEMRGIIV